MTADSKKYDLPTDEVQRLILGLLTAARIDTATAAKFWADTFPGHPDIPIEDMPSYLELHGQILGMLVQIINFLHDEPVTGPYIKAILDGLRTGDVF